MSGRKVIVSTGQAASKYEVRIDAGSRTSCGQFTRKALGKFAHRAIVVSNKKVFGLYGGDVVRSFNGAGFQTSVHLIGDGERFKTIKTLGQLLATFSENGISRTDVVVALGGGVVGDIAGFAAATHLRGVAYVQIPTTLLSMIDSSVGGKTGVNTPRGKNLAGAFYHPKVVLIDPAVLRSLPKRELTAGFCEAIKQGAIAGRSLFEETAATVKMFAAGSKTFEQHSELSAFLADQVAFKANIVAGDERESATNTSSRSRKILNFGHTFAHALENATNYSYLKHGEAVGYGVMFASTLSKKLGILDESVVNLLRDVVHASGGLPSLQNLDPKLVFEALKHDKKNISGSLNWILLKGIGKPTIVPHEKVGDKVVKDTIAEFTAQ